MIRPLIDFVRHRDVSKTPNFRLAMTMLVRDEVDIVEQNIRFHAHHGVDVFWVMDHLSKDGTRDVLEGLKSEFEIHIVDQSANGFFQAEWMTLLASRARTKSHADWCIHNDADEFWAPQNGKTLKEALVGYQTSVRIPRHNMLLSENDDENFRLFSWRTKFPIEYVKNIEIESPDISIDLAGASPKVATNLHGLLEIKAGQHNARHIGDYVKGRKYEAISQEIVNYHYPTRSFEQYERVSLNRYQRILDVMKNNDKKTNYGSVARRRATIVENNLLEYEFQKLIFKEKELKILEKYGLVEKDEFMLKSFQE